MRESRHVDSICLSLSELRLFLGLGGKLLSKSKRPGPVLGTQWVEGHPKVRQGRGALGLACQVMYREEGRKPQLRDVLLGDIPVAACLPTPKR